MYYIPLILIAMLVFFTKLDNKKKLILAIIPILLIVWFRFGFGADYFSYEYLYNSLDVSTFGNMLNSQTRVEVGYRMLEFPFLKFGIDYQVFVAFLGTTMILLYSKWIFDNSDQPLISLALFYGMFFTVWILSALRQGLVLVIATHLFFNDNVQLKPIKRVTIILLLSLIHLSALFLIPLILLGEIKWNRKRLAYFLCLGLFVSLIPIELVLSYLTFIPGVNSVINYARSGFGFFDFPSFVRLIFFGVVWFHYDAITLNSHKKRITDTFLITMSLYFFLKFSEIAASRLTMYGFILAVLVLTYISDLYRDNKIMGKLVTVGLLAFSMVYLQKELTTVSNQTGYVRESVLVDFNSVFDQNYEKFNHRLAFLTDSMNACRIDKHEFNESKNEKQVIVEYDYSKGNVVVRDSSNGKYGVINDEGNWILEPIIENRPTLYESVLVSVDSSGLSNVISYYDLSKSGMNKTEMQNIVEEVNIKNSDDLITEEELIEFTVQEIPQGILDQILFPQNIDKISAIKVNKPFNYYVVRFHYYNDPIYIYLDENRDLLTDLMFTSNSRFDNEEILVGQQRCGSIIINNDGEVIWR